jgi:glycosyltransferase involved in cell wall biosynthesis
MRIVQITTDSREHFKDYHTPKPYFGAAPEALLAGFAELPGVEVHVVCCLRNAVAPTPKLADNIHYHPLVVPKSGWMSSFYYGCSSKIRGLCKSLQPDIVHGQGTERECAITAVRSGFPSVVTIHGNVQELHRLGMFGKGLYGPLASFLESRALGKASGVFCNSDYTRSLVGPRAKHTWLVPNAIRSEFFQPFTGGSKRPVPTLVIVGLICARKRQLELLRMAGEIARSGRALNLVFAGDLSEGSEYGAAFAQELHKAKAGGYAEFAGFLNVQELVRLLDTSHAFLHFPSEEAFGLVVAEAMARGLKFFGAKLGGIVNIADGIDGAELHDDFASLQAGIIRWLDAGAPAPAQATEEIARRYHPVVVAKEHLKIYREVLGRETMSLE